MYNYLLKLYLKLSDINKVHISINYKNLELEKAIEWCEFILGNIKPGFINDIISENNNIDYDLFSLIKELERHKDESIYNNEIDMLLGYLIPFNNFIVKEGSCSNCQIGLWIHDKFGGQKCIYHAEHKCSLYPNEYYSAM